MKGSSLGLYFDPRGAGSTPAREKAFFFNIPLSRLFLFSSFVLPSLNYLLNIEFARYKISTNWDHKADWANGKGGVSRSAIDYRQTFPELQPSLSIQDTTTCTTTTGICGMRVSGLGLDGGSRSSSISSWKQQIKKKSPSGYLEN